MDDKSFYELCKAENTKLASIVDQEVVSDETAYISQIIVNNMLVDGVGDALLYASALNILNTYVKQSKECKKAVGYSFKNKVSVLLNYIINNPNEYMDAEIQDDNGTNLAIIDIFGIQFSFHNVTVTESTTCLKAKDPDHPRLTWDGLRKHTCSVTLYNFSYENDYGRTNEMLDGSDFISCTDSLVEEFRNGTKTLSDVGHCIYKKGDHDQLVKSYTVEEYPEKNNYIVHLESYDAQTLMAKISDRSLVPELNELYQKKTGQYMSYAVTLSAKYAFESLYSFLSSSNVNPSTGVYVAFNKIPSHEAFAVFLTSCSKSGENNIVCMELLNWTSVKKADDGYVTVRDDYTGLYRTTRHPGYHKINEMFDRLSNLMELDQFDFKHCIFLYDLSKTEDNDIVSGEDDMAASIFYASDRDSLTEYLSPVLNAGNGTELVSTLDSLFNSMTLYSGSSISYEHYLAVENCIDCLKSDPRSLYIINYRKAKSNTDMLDYISQEFKDNHLKFSTFTSADIDISGINTEIALFADCIPQDEVLDKVKNVIVICDLYAPSAAFSNEIDDLIDYSYDSSIPVHRTDIVSAIGFCDGGNGNNYLLRHLELSAIEYRNWSPSKYPISVVDSQQEFIEDDGIKNVVIPESVSYDFNGRHIVYNGGKDALYHELLDAPNGVRLLINSQSLKNYLCDGLSKHTDYADWASETLSDEGLRNVLNFAKNSASNSSDYNKYMSLVIEALHTDAWVKISEECQDWVVSAVSSYYYTKDVDISMDFSGVALLISKTFEVELCDRLSVKYADYLKNKYGDNYIDELPEPLYKESNNGKVPQDPDTVTLGSLPYIMGLDSKGRIKSKKDYNNFIAYCNDGLLVHPENVDKNLPELCDIIYYVRVTFRNPSAHKKSISFETATDCITYCITEKRELGVALDMFNK